MSSRDRSLLVVVGALVVLALAWFAVVSPKRSESADLQTQITAVRGQLVQANADVARYTAARDHLRNEEKGLRAAGKALPTRVAMPALLRQLERTAAEDGVEMTALSTGTSSAVTPGVASASTPTAGIATVPLSLSFTGDFVDLQRYLARLQRFVHVSAKNVDATGRLFAINGIRLAPGGKLPSLSASVDATVYVLDPAAAQAATQPATTPAAPGTTAPAAASTGASPTPTATAEVPR